MPLNEQFALLALDAECAAPVKQLVFKPKVAKSAIAVPVVVVALQSTTTPVGVVAHASGSKDPRLARDELFQSHFGVETAKAFDLSHLEQAQHGFQLLVDRELAALADEAAVGLSGVAVEKGALMAYLQKHGAVEVDFAQEVQAAAPKAKKGAAVVKESAALADAKLIGITVDKALDFPGWYQQVLVKGDLLDYYDISGCYILKPASYCIWERIQEWFNGKIRSMGVQNVCFPMFISSRALEKEKDHIEGFAPEVAWVTKAGSSDLEEPIAIRPTSETAMYPFFAKWVQSYRDLPLKYNQWTSVVRWEFKHPQPFLRTREFLWQEGHTAHLTKEEATDEVMQILDHYEQVYVELLAVPVVKGTKTENEKFAGADFTTSVEGYIPQTGRGIQGATSHHLGQNFSKMFNICVENPLGPQHPKVHAYQNSWGLSTRSIGVMVMTHSDNKGLVIPPRVAQHQVVILPVGITAKTKEDVRSKIHDSARAIENRLHKAGIRVLGDYADNYTPGWKFAQYELKGVPLRLEFGPKDMEKAQVTAVRRNDGAKISVPLADLEERIPQILDEMHQLLYQKAKKSFDDHLITVTEWKDFVPTLNKKNIILSPWCGVPECETDIKASSAKKDDGDEYEVDEKAPSMGAKSLCVPFEQPVLAPGQKCIKCDKPAVNYCMFGRSY
ncbi:AEL021Cp [Eremothecium gossypii ATCC 10895]|uniref:proline--tRNA ligase n=1 Tax=Eremothecium gossypii (strain ATCC 10895 / CBS 109.51 / FGSC 9923 / NRRL Y-1056) TaxID=284811 RepID=Q757N3_EREGS|nr:AEL021Cp [Eremothecium gossypii ATCC 10895]AAS52664.1 AEL021Cp [Eremothecium gossypii ATCC 10895]AEY96969.1 FAEL021Cp [Eremothecium gossypii FDAG1]